MPHSKLERLVPVRTLIAQAYDAILDAICDGRLAPGSRLNQDALAERLLISRQPVGQALSILRTQGFVRDAGRRGLIVAPLEREFFRAVYQLREALDPMAARQAAQRRSREQLERGREILAVGRKAVRSGNVHDAIAADMEFHIWKYRAAGNPLLVETMIVYWNHLRRAMGEVLRRPAMRKNIWDEHERIFDAIAGGDSSTAARIALAHVRDAAERVAAAMPAGQADRKRASEELPIALSPTEIPREARTGARRGR